jgi:hypothetical protein
MSLEKQDFALFGQWLRKSSIPAGAILEGGYSDELPQLIDAFLSTWATEGTLPKSFGKGSARSE